MNATQVIDRALSENPKIQVVLDIATVLARQKIKNCHEKSEYRLGWWQYPLTHNLPCNHAVSCVAKDTLFPIRRVWSL